MVALVTLVVSTQLNVIFTASAPTRVVATSAPDQYVYFPQTLQRVGSMLLCSIHWREWNDCGLDMRQRGEYLRAALDRTVARSRTMAPEWPWVLETRKATSYS